MRILLCYTIFNLLAIPLIAQDWNWVNSFGGMGLDGLEAMAIGTEGEVLLGGSFEGEVDFGGNSLEALVGRDAFLTKLDAQGNISWVRSGGGPSNDISVDVAFDDEGNTIWLGQYWITGFFEQDTIVAGSNGKAYFVAKYDAEGTLIWIESINGSATKVVSDLVVDGQGDIYLTGYFNDSLMIDDFILTSNHVSDAFVLKMSKTGEVINGYTYGDAGEVQPKRIVQTSEGDLVIAGQLFGTVTFGNDTLVSVPTDLDLFIAKIDTSGIGLWGRIGTGVFDNIMLGLSIDANDDLYVTGNFVGVLGVDGTEVLTPSFTENLYLLKLESNGTLSWIRALNDQVFNDPSSGMDLSFKDDMVMMTGQFSGDLLIDDLSVNSSGGGTKGFIAGFARETGSVRRLSKIRGNDPTSGVRIETGPTGLIYIAGVYLGDVSFDDQVFVSAGLTDGFVAQSTDLFTSIDLDVVREKVIALYPNPASTFLQIATEEADFECRIYNGQGLLIKAIRNKHYLDIHGFSPGLYYLQYFAADHFELIPFIKL